MTNISAFLFAYSGVERQEASLKSMWAILKRQRRVVQQPLASTSDWTRWDSALEISMWIFTFTRWSEHYLRQRGTNSRELEQMSREAGELAMARSMVEWRSQGANNQGELAAFRLVRLYRCQSVGRKLIPIGSQHQVFPWSFVRNPQTQGKSWRRSLCHRQSSRRCLQRYRRSLPSLLPKSLFHRFELSLLPDLGCSRYQELHRKAHPACFQ